VTDSSRDDNHGPHHEQRVQLAFAFRWAARQWEDLPAAEKHFGEMMAILDEEEPDYRL